MLQRIDLRAGLGTLRGVLPRAAVNISDGTASDAPPIDDVRHNGADAVLAASERFDVASGPSEVFGARGMGRSVYVRDPDGNLVELRCY